MKLTGAWMQMDYLLSNSNREFFSVLAAVRKTEVITRGKKTSVAILGTSGRDADV